MSEEQLPISQPPMSHAATSAAGFHLLFEAFAQHLISFV
jgi:hypothetical protein